MTHIELAVAATTRAPLRWIHDQGPFRRALDVGTGSGVLALVAGLRLHDERLDPDPGAAGVWWSGWLGRAA